jgi:hypothetical protein
LAKAEKKQRPRWGEAEQGSLAWRARFDRELKQKIEEGRKRTREDSRELEHQLLKGESGRDVRMGY